MNYLIELVDTVGEETINKLWLIKNKVTLDKNLI